MSSTDPHMQIARKLRSLETAKIELVQQVAEVLRSLKSANERELARSLGELVALAYFIGGQTGTPLEAIDRALQEGLPRSLNHEPADAADFAAVLRHLALKR